MVNESNPCNSEVQNDDRTLATVAAPCPTAALDEYAKLTGFDSWQRIETELKPEPGAFKVVEAPNADRHEVMNL